MFVAHCTFIKDNTTGFPTLESDRDLNETSQHLTNTSYKIIVLKIKSCENKLSQEKIILESIQQDFNKKRDLKELQRTCRIINNLENEIARLNYLLMNMEI